MRNISNYAFLVALAATALANSAPAQTTGTFNTIHSFNFTPDMETQDGTFVMDQQGSLYAPTSSGGAFNSGAIFELSPPSKGVIWNESLAYSFTGGADGNEPYQALVFDNSGNLYGSTLYGGTVNAACPSGCGVVFKLAPPATQGGEWTQSVLYSFTGGTDGAHPNGNLVFNKNGALYGTANSGGVVNSTCPDGCGVIFRVVPPAAGGAWTQSVVYSFQGGVDGAIPGAGLVIDTANQTLYGTTFAGGTINQTCSVSNGPPSCGVVFQLVPPKNPGGAWTENVLHSFPGGDPGSGPDAVLVFDQHGNLYGTTIYGGKGRPIQGGGNSGVVFQLMPPAKPGAAWQFNEYLLNHTRGNHPYGGLAVDSAGNLYGTALFGGNFFLAKGLLFELTPPATAGGQWTEVLLHSFSDHGDGGNPFAGVLVGPNNVLYGTTATGGARHGGTAFQMIP